MAQVQVGKKRVPTVAAGTRATVRTKVPIVGKQVLSGKKRVPAGTVVKSW